MEVLILSGVGKKFFFQREDRSHIFPERDNSIWALRDITLSIKKGESVGILGRNASGKTTLLKIMAGIYLPTVGQITRSAKVVSVFDIGSGLKEELTGRENIYFYGTLLGMGRQYLNSNLDKIIEFSELANFIEYPLGLYSQGMKMRLGFSVAINTDFEVIILDEVLRVGDISFQRKCISALQNAMRQGKTVVFVTQDINLVKILSQRCVVLDNGGIVFDGNPSEGVNEYLKILNERSFLERRVGGRLIESTKKWAEDSHKWGKREGGGGIVIEHVEFLGRWNQRLNKLNPLSSLKVRVWFYSSIEFKDVVFGVAFFREDGVYCYGPNTGFDNYRIKKLGRGKGSFTIEFFSFPFSAGCYFVSVALWNKTQDFAYDYHIGCYQITIAGDIVKKSLVVLPCRRISHPGFSKKDLFREELLTDIEKKWGQRFSLNGWELNSVDFFDIRGETIHTAITGNSLDLRLIFNRPIKKGVLLWIGIYREDKVCCWKSFFSSKRTNCTIMLRFFSLFLLPGRYCFSVGLYDTVGKDFVCLHHGVYFLSVVSHLEDHGTVYVPHRWFLNLPQNSCVGKNE